MNPVDIAISPETATVIEYCRAMNRNEVVVNRDYQRSDKIWPVAAQSFLIESLLLGYPIPKITLLQVTNVEARETHREIVDGQQRSEAIQSFFQDKLVLSDKIDSEDLKGKALSELEEAFQARFLNYRLAIDVLIGAEPEEVRETFRRMNSYMVPLNPEEQRHALYQGPFKWFIYRLAKLYDRQFIAFRLFKEKALLRMQDMKLLTEVCHAFFYGIQTTNKSSLEKLYARFERSFAVEDDLEPRVRQALDQLFDWEELIGTEIMRPFMCYSLILALMHVQEPLDHIDVGSALGSNAISENAVANLTALSEEFANRDEETTGEFPQFVQASVKSTNTRANRDTRFQFFYRAITDQMDAPVP
jgi:hypothetical protein